MTLSATPKGTKEYIAPEIRNPNNGHDYKYGKPADVWAFGVVRVIMISWTKFSFSELNSWL